MRITDVVCYTSGSPQRAFYVKIETESGVSGWGECSPMHESAVLALITDTIRPQIIGRSVFDAEEIEERILQRNYKIAGQLLAMAYSGVEMALWDARARILHQPVYNLIGGRYRDSVAVYGSSMSRHLSPDQEAQKLTDGIARFGFEAVKIKVGPRLGTGQPVRIADDVAKVALVREAIGPNVGLMVDANSSYTVAEAIRFYRQAERFDLLHFEEPCHYRDIASYETLARSLPGALLHVGEQDWDIFTFRDFLARRACHLYAPDPMKCGGFSGARRAAVLCRAFGVTYAPHNTSRGLGLAAALQLAAATPECSYYFEFSLEEDARITHLSHVFRPEAGRIGIPDGPGVGVLPDEEKIAQSMTRTA